MRNKTILTICLIIFPTLILGYEISDQYSGWKGNIKIENGIRIIKNPKDPLYGTIRLDLEEELNIGREDDDNYLFWAISDIAVDAKDNIYVCDMKYNRIQKYDRSGKYLQTIGRQGQGPGEFQLPAIIRICNLSGNIYVKDYARNIVVFDEHGKFLRNIRLKDVVEDFVPVDNGSFLSVLHKTADPDLSSVHSLCSINSQGEISRIYAEFPYTIFTAKAWGGTIMASTGYELSLYLIRLDDQSYLYGYSKNYELVVIDKDGNMLYRINRDEPSIKFTYEERRKLKNSRIPGYMPPEYKPHFYMIWCDSRGRIYVQRNRAHTTVRGKGSIDISEKEVDIFNKDGYFLYKTTLPRNTRVIKDGFLYSYKADEEGGFESVLRYKIKNWDQIR